MAWNDGLTEEQKAAASYYGSNARLLAGPGTGKTRVMSRRVSFLVEGRVAEPGEILAITFTRAAAHELRKRVIEDLGPDNVPRISTLHSFALRQLLRNASRLDDWPNPTRIADDWEERHVILEDIKRDLDLRELSDVRELFAKLQADWESLEADSAAWQPDPRFLSAWREHSRAHGYVLRSELVYAVKRALEQHASFTLESGFKYLLVDEYQDLNKCDLAIIGSLAARGLEVFAAGDDDQSIYGFRKAHPEGIRRFVETNPPAKDLVLTTCKRCAPEILKLAEFVAQQDRDRQPKTLQSDAALPPGDVRLSRHDDQGAEAQYIAGTCRELISREGLPPNEILILLRADRNRAFSAVLAGALSREDIPVASRTAQARPLDSDTGRKLLSLLRLCCNRSDSLAWRTLLQLPRNGIGSEAIPAIRRRCAVSAISFSTALQAIAADSATLARYGKPVRDEYERLIAAVSELPPDAEGFLQATLSTAMDLVVCKIGVIDPEEVAIVREYLRQIAEESGCDSIAALSQAVETSNEDIEQLLDPVRVNILTMHQAKGLSADTVFIPGAEDEYVPGRQLQEPLLSDERRLLYVSMTRARKRLFISYCESRFGQQQRTGRNPDTRRRTLTRFLRDAPLHPR
ncbi:MAG: ATP-dependent helicase [Armatimonadetes bacterium]|nr:ATP-dependent helicase [Armatimonadota bacterium]